jgi:hypothetical protein
MYLLESSYLKFLNILKNKNEWMEMNDVANEILRIVSSDKLWYQEVKASGSVIVN